MKTFQEWLAERTKNEGLWLNDKNAVIGLSRFNPLTKNSAVNKSLAKKPAKAKAMPGIIKAHPIQQQKASQHDFALTTTYISQHQFLWLRLLREPVQMESSKRGHEHLAIHQEKQFVSMYPIPAYNRRPKIRVSLENSIHRTGILSS